MGERRAHQMATFIRKRARNECPKKCDPFWGCQTIAHRKIDVQFTLPGSAAGSDVSAILINSFLPLYTYSSLRLQGHYVPLDYYLELEEKLKSESKQSRRFSLNGISSRLFGEDKSDRFTWCAGILMDTKRDLLLGAAIPDLKFSLIAAICVFSLLVAYSLGLAFSLAVVWQVCLL